MLNGDELLNIEIVKNELKPVFESYGVKKAILFGSIAKGTNTKDSDVDLIVDSGLKGLKFFGLVYAISECVYRDVDVFDVREIKVDSRIDKEIKKTGVTIYGK